MANPASTFIISDENRRAFERISSLSKNDNANLFVHGPRESGKTALFTFLSKQADEGAQLSKMLTHAPEILAAIQLDSNDTLLTKAGSVDVLFVDGFDHFFEDKIGPNVFHLLITERSRLGLSTVVAARYGKSHYDLSEYGDPLQSFEDLLIEPLGEKGRIDYVSKDQEALLQSNSNLPKLSKEAIEFLANDFSASLHETSIALQFLLMAADFPPNHTISREDALHALDKA